MSAETDAVNDIIWLGKRFRGLLGITDDLAKYGTIKDGIEALERKIADLKKTADEAQAKAKADQEAAASSKLEVEAVLDDRRKKAEVDALAIRDKVRGETEAAKKEAADLLASAKQSASQIMTDAKATAVSKADEAQAMVEQAIKDRDEAVAQAKEAKKQYDTIMAEVAGLRSRLQMTI